MICSVVSKGPSHLCSIFRHLVGFAKSAIMEAIFHQHIFSKSSYAVMQKIFLALLLFAVLGSSCGIFSQLTSTTQIEANKSFVLGQGNHGSYNANIKNIAKSNVEVFKSAADGTMVSLGILEPGDQQQYAVPKDTKVAFMNIGKSMARIEIKLVGDTNLSMGYSDNKEVKVIPK